MREGERQVEDAGKEIRCPICNKKFGNWMNAAVKTVIGLFCRRCGKIVKIEKNS